jgi:hypothetical protein
MISLATSLVQKFDKYWQICGNQRVLIISFTKLLIIVPDETISKGPTFTQDSGEWGKELMTQTSKHILKSSYNQV